MSEDARHSAGSLLARRIELQPGSRPSKGGDKKAPLKEALSFFERLSPYIHTYIYIHMHMYMFICIYIYMCVYIYVHVQVQIGPNSPQ